MKNLFSKYPFFVRCIFLNLSLIFTLSLHGQSESQSQLDTLSSITERENIINYILKIEADQKLYIRDSIVDVAVELTERINSDSLLYEVMSADMMVDWLKGDYKIYKSKADVTYELAKKLSEKKRLDILSNIANYYGRSGEFEKADSIYLECYNSWIKTNDTESLSKNFNNRAIISLRRSDFERADSLVQIAKKYGEKVGARVLASALTTELATAGYSGQNKKAYMISKKILEVLEPISEKHLSFYGGCLFNNGNLAADLGNRKEALSSYLKADSIYQVIKNEKRQIESLAMLGYLYNDIGDYDLAVSYLKKALDVSKSGDFPEATARSMKSLSLFYLNKGDVEDLRDSKSLLDSAFHYFTEKNVLSEIGHCHHARAEIFVFEEKLDSALVFFDKAITLFESEGFDHLLSNVYFGKAEILHDKDRPREALKYLNKINPEKYETESELVQYNYLKGKALSKTGSAAAANELLLKAYDKNAELVEASQTKEIKEIADKYQADKQIAISDKLKAEQAVKELTISRQKSILGYGGLGLGLVSLLSFLLFRQSRKRQLLNKDLQQQKSQVLLLNQELNHRVKNNLSFMTTLLEMQGRRTDSEETRQALQESEGRLKALSLVHANLFKNESDTHINLKDYLQEILGHLQEIFGAGEKALSINANFMDRVVDAEDAMRIGLILNELVTNSVKHAFAQVDNPRIDIETIKEGDKIVLKYKDNGPGIQKAQIGQDPRKQSLGVKLIGILERQVSEVLRLEVG